MKTCLKYSILVLALALGTSSRAHARDHHPDPPPPPPPPPCKNVAPEVDPSMAVAGLSLLGGTLVVLRSRRSKQ